mgnify:CR=1 FL=1
MLISEITEGILTEGVQQIWGRNAGKVVKRYRCTTGSRKGRIVATPTTCNAPKKIGSMITMKKARRMRSPVLQIKSSRRKRAGAASQRLAKANKPLSQKRYGKASARSAKLGGAGRRPTRNVAKTGVFRTRSYKPKKLRSKRIK